MCVCIYRYHDIAKLIHFSSCIYIPYPYIYLYVHLHIDVDVDINIWIYTLYIYIHIHIHYIYTYFDVSMHISIYHVTHIYIYSSF